MSASGVWDSPSNKKSDNWPVCWANAGKASKSIHATVKTDFVRLCMSSPLVAGNRVFDAVAHHLKETCGVFKIGVVPDVLERALTFAVLARLK